MTNDEHFLHDPRVVILEDLQSGRVVRVRQSDYCRLTGISEFTAERDRVRGRGCVFRKENSKIWYYANEILAYLSLAVPHAATSEYDTASHVDRLEKARRVLAESGKNRGRRRKQNAACSDVAV